MGGLKTRLIVDDLPRPGRFQMSADDFLAETLSASGYDAAVRFYTWSPPAVSLGCHQQRDIVNLDACRGSGWDVVFRPTGGRALLHQGDLSYAVIVGTDGNPYHRFRRLYSGIAEAMTDAFRRLGLSAEVVSSGKSSAGQCRNFRAGICLDSRVRGEVLVRGFKVCAAAQRIYDAVILQHGSILLHGDPGAIAQAASLTEYDIASLGEKLRARARPLSEIVGWSISPEVLVELLLDSFAHRLGLDIISDAWISAELSAIASRSNRFNIRSVVPRAHISNLPSGKAVEIGG